MEQTMKKPWQSKTLVVNAVMGLLAFVALFWPGADGIRQFIDTNAEGIAMVWAVANMALRFITKDRVGLSE